MSDNKQALQVAALKNGTVIDHIPSDKLFTLFLFAVMTFQDSMFFVNYMKQGGLWLIVGDTFGIGAFL